MAKIPMKKQLCLAVPNGIYNRISRIAEKENKSKSEVVREVLLKHIRNTRRGRK